MESTITEEYSSSLKVNINLIDPIVVIYECKIAYRLYAYGTALLVVLTAAVVLVSPVYPTEQLDITKHLLSLMK